MFRKRLVLAVVILGFFLGATAQNKQILIADYENKPNTDGWWKDNANVKFSYNENPACQINKKSKVCLYVRWDSVPQNRPFAWFTDLKADTFAVDGMEEAWKSFKENTWMSFWCKAGDGDTLMLNFLVLSKGHKSKWGAANMIPLTSKNWTFIKVKFADLQVENWGIVKADFDLKSDAVKCFEVGLRLSATSPKGYVEGWFDNIKLTNYEPLN
jgi:uncharacterized membrane protein YkgB